MPRLEVTNPEPAQGSQRPALRGPGAEVLRLIGYPVVRKVLVDLGRRSRRPSEIDLGWRVDVSTFHRHAPELLAVKAITRRSVPGPPRQVFYSLGPTGAELCALIDGWHALLPSAPRTDWRGPIGFGEAWAAGVTQALLDGPLGLPEIEMSVHLARPGVTGHQVRRLLRNKGRAGFLLPEGPRGQERYRLADRGRYAVGELATSARFERLNMPETAVPIAVDDVVDALRAHLPLLKLPVGLEGVCEFAVVGDPGRRNGVALAWAEVGHGRVVASGSGRPPQPADTWARGTIGQWMATVIDHRRDGISAAGERPLGRAVVDALQHTAISPLRTLALDHPATAQ
jgi:DNA-binding HxlR family transcriptional regulator